MFFYYGTNENMNICGQSFSGTDKSTSNDIGVVYPLSCSESIKNMLNISSILDHRHPNLCKNTEARIANADTEKKIVEYKETKCVALEYDNDTCDLDQLLMKTNKSIYQSEVIMTGKLEVRIDEITALLSTKNFSAIHFIDSDNLESKKYTYTYSPTLFEDFYANNDLSYADEKILDIFVKKFEIYFEELDKSKRDKVIKHAVKYYYSEVDYDKMLSSSLWGKDIDKTAKEYKELFKNDKFKKTLADYIIDIIQYYDIAGEESNDKQSHDTRGNEV